MKFVGIVGTNSDTSTNRSLLQFMAKHFTDNVEIEVCEIKDLPAFNEPEDTTAPVAVQELSDKIMAADGVIFATPEYDHTITAALKSALEWLSYTTRPLINKPTMIVGASHGSLGSSRAQAHMRQILDSPELKARIMPGTEFLLGRSLQAFDEAGNLIDENKVKELEEDFQEFALFAEMTNKLMADDRFATQQERKFTWEMLGEA